MSLNAFLEPTHLLTTIVLALSIFNLVTFFWLTITVWLNGDRRTWIARLGVTGLGLSSLFFFIHSLLLASPLSGPQTATQNDILWHLIWVPALGVPFIWFAIGLYYAGLLNAQWRRRRPVLLTIGFSMGSLVLLLFFLNDSTFTYAGFLQLLAYGNSLDGFRFEMVSPLLLPGMFLYYVTFCAIGPWFTPARVGRLLKAVWSLLQPQNLALIRLHKPFTLHQTLSDAFWEDQDQVDLEEPELSWHLARPGLLLAAMLMVALTTTLGVIIIWSIVNWFENEQHPLRVHFPELHAFPLNVAIIDFLATGAVSLIILLVGFSIVRYGILIERPLPRRGFFEQWRGIVIVSTAIALFIATLVTLTQGQLGGLLVITCLATCAYALFTWNGYATHDRYISLLGPFLRSTSLRHWMNTDQEKTERELEDLFYHLCADVLAVRCARLMILAGPVRRHFSYRWPDEAWEDEHQRVVIRSQSGVNARRVQILFKGQSMICWLLPIYDERRLVAALYLGPRQNGGAFTTEDMNLAQACGQRILDTLGDHEAMQAVASLLRRRIVDVKLLGAQQRRVLHDEILPQMHLALLHLETARSLNEQQDTVEDGQRERQQLNQAIEKISDSHRQLAAMMRVTAPGSPHRLERDGMMQAIQTMVEQDFRQAFDEVHWEVSEEDMARIDEAMPPAIAELIFAAVQEALRNAARHGRGQDLHRQLRVTLWASYTSDVEVIVSDNGIGISSTGSSTTGTGGGLITHSALLTIAGGSLTIESAPTEGVRVRIFLPATALR